jgi:hypothetical protein
VTNQINGEGLDASRCVEKTDLAAVVEENRKAKGRA